MGRKHHIINIARYSVAWVGMASLAASPAYAQTPVVNASLPASNAKLGMGPIVSESAPVVLQADQIDYDQEHGVVYASGHVEITQGATIVLADAIMYDQKRGEVQAQGHVSMLEPSGHVFFAESLALTDDMKAGVIQQFKARLSDDSVFVANGAKKVNESRLELFKAAYTPCKCDRGTGGNPTWSVRAEHATIDQEKQKVSYENAYFSALGVPIIYTPYFSHPTPDAENQSGLLMPEFLQSRNLGAVFKQPVYYAIAPDKDVTVTPIFTSKEGLVMAGNYRQMLDSGLMNLTGSATSTERRDGLGNRATGREFRGHVDANAAFKVDEHYNWGFNVRRASDETYLRRFNFSNDPFLNSRVYAEGFNFLGGSNRNYGSIEGLSFQGLTGQDASALVPVVAPLTFVTWQSDPLQHNARFTFEGNSMVLFRDRGSDSR
ncbi:MAG: LPS assembly protein LptD, partial [Rickettsiales bacterium]|nr:LPS assembly protein LptD [Rickettsiales bacterium]